jgi:nitroimidazol reductase NimA-like FMN-containing flavoprotein (pyridoxamine 5'-phosphate oxidase superfamily)
MSWETDPRVMVAAMLERARILRLATNDSSGQATAAPFWFVYRHERIVIGALENTTTRNLRRDGRVTILIDHGVSFADIHGAIIQGKASVYDRDSAPAAVVEAGSMLDERYVKELTERASLGHYHRRRPGNPVYIDIFPTLVRWYTVGGLITGHLDFSNP